MKMKKNPLGIPWWAWVGGVAAALYFATKKAAAKAPSTIPDPYGGKQAPKQEFYQTGITPTKFSSMCSALKGVMVAGSCVGAEHFDLPSGKNVLKLMPNGQVFNMTTNQWVYDL